MKKRRKFFLGISRMRNMSFSSLKFGLRRHDKQGKGKEERKKRSSTYPSNKGRHKAGDDELLIVQSLEKPPSVRKNIPP